jgi:subfamily B ATP-binding cassette protein MsbA
MSLNGSNVPPVSVVPAGPGAGDSAAKREKKKKDLVDFWRAARFLLPYRRKITISVVAAFFIGLAMAGGLGSIIPVLRVLISGDTIPSWINRTIAESRMDIKIASESSDLGTIRVTAVEKTGPGQAAGLLPGDLLVPHGQDPAPVLSTLADPGVSEATLHLASGRTVTVSNLEKPAWFVPYLTPMVRRFPINPVKAIACVLVLCILISAFGNGVSYFQQYYSDSAAILAINDIRRRLYDHILHTPMAFFGTAGTSDVTSRLVQDCSGLQEGFGTILGPSIQMPINAATAFILALWYSWKLTLFIILVAPLLVMIIQKFGKKMRRASRRALQRSSSMLGQIEATLLGIRLVKGANAERFERRRYASIMNGLSEQQLRMSRIDAISSPVMELLTLMVVSVVVIWATYLVRITHEINSIRFFAVMACLATIGESLRKAGKINGALQKSGASAARIFQILDLPVERPRQMVHRPDRPRISMKPIQREIRFEHLDFAYANTSSPALTDVNLTVAKGESVAIVGRNGSGKTTLLALLPRLFDPGNGRICIDDVDIQSVTLKSLRDQITLVTQDSVVFPMTIAENIAYGHPLAGRLTETTPAIVELRAKIEAAARQAFAHDFIMEKPAGYDTLLSGLGGALSGGQKQRLNIARAILRDTPILILDEATSQVDAESEHLIQQAVESLMHDRTMFVIAHRLNTIKHADRIIVMDRGQIVATGSHEELLKTSEAYNNLYERQLFIRPDETPPAASA